MRGSRVPTFFKKYDIRGVVPDELSIRLAVDLGVCFSKYWDRGKILVGRDGRHTSDAIASAVKAGLMSGGSPVVNIGLSTTDELAYLVRKLGFAGGIQVTASHMPANENGIKPINSVGRILTNEEMKRIKSRYLKGACREIECASYGHEENKFDHINLYKRALRQRYNEFFRRDLKELTVVYDAMHGVGALIVPPLLAELGAKVIRVNDRMDPSFGRRRPEPTEKTLRTLGYLTVQHGGDLGIQTDGDCDRVMFANERGEPVDGNDVLAIIGFKYLKNVNRIVCSVETSPMVEEFLRDKGMSVEYVRVGAVFTALKVLEEKLVFGGQPNGHLMDSNFVPYDSGSLFAMILCGLIVENGRNLTDIQGDLEPYRYYHKSISVPSKNQKLQMRLVNAHILEKGYKVLSRMDGILFAPRKDVRILVRPSGSTAEVRLVGYSKESGVIQEFEEEIEQVVSL